MTVRRGVSTSRRRTLAGFEARLGAPVFIHRQAIFLPAGRELPEVAVEPSHDDLDDIVQHLEGDRGRHLDLAPDQRIAVHQLDADMAISLKVSVAVVLLAGLMAVTLKNDGRHILSAENA